MRGLEYQALAEDYLNRIRHYTRCDIVELKDDTELVRRWPNFDVIVTLEVGGESFSSEQFAQILERWGSQGRGRIALVIGGTNGIPPRCAGRAECNLSLSPMTLPHRLARILILEQLYRAFTILNHEPYARES